MAEGMKDSSVVVLKVISNKALVLVVASIVDHHDTSVITKGRPVLLRTAVVRSAELEAATLAHVRGMK
jgi:hypothetical protein